MKGMNPKYGFKNYNDSSIYCRVIRKNKKIKTKKITTFSRENVRENNKKFIENNMRRKKKVKIKNIVINTKLFKSCYIIK